MYIIVALLIIYIIVDAYNSDVSETVSEKDIPVIDKDLWTNPNALGITINSIIIDKRTNKEIQIYKVHENSVEFFQEKDERFYIEELECSTCKVKHTIKVVKDIKPKIKCKCSTPSFVSINKQLTGANVITIFSNKEFQEKYEIKNPFSKLKLKVKFPLQ